MRIYLFFCFLFFAMMTSGQENLSSAAFYETMNEEKNIIVFDTRIYGEFIQNRIPGAVYAGEKEILLERVDNMDRDKVILVYCEYGDRSETVMEILKEEGFHRLYHLENGFVEWREQDFPVDDSEIEEKQP